MSTKLTHDKFLEKLKLNNSHYRDGEFIITGIYEGSDKKIEIEGFFGKCLVLANSLITRNSKPSINTALNKTEYFKKEMLEVNKYYKEGLFKIIGKYKGRKNHIKLKYKSLEYNVIAMELLQDYLPNIQTTVDKSIFWLEKFKTERKDFKNIDYSYMKYKTSRENVNFKCKIHNIEYSQRLDHHYNNVQGCIRCMQYPIMYNEDTIVKHKIFLETLFGFLYVIKLESKEEIFYKVGITGDNRIEYRFSELEKHYKVSFEYLQNGCMVELFNLEQRFLKEFKKFQYIPKIKFRGYTECLTTNPIAEYYYKYYIENNEPNN